LRKIVILKDEADGDKGLPALMRALFPECEVVSVSRKGDGDVKERFEKKISPS